MKTKTFFFICLLLGLGLTQLSAQKEPNDSKSIVWEIAHAHGTIQSDWGEVFTVKEVNKEFIPMDGYIIGSTNLNGDQGSHFIFNMTFDKDWNIVSIKTEGCPVNKK